MFTQLIKKFYPELTSLFDIELIKNFQQHHQIDPFYLLAQLKNQNKTTAFISYNLKICENLDKKLNYTLKQLKRSQINLYQRLISSNKANQINMIITQIFMPYQNIRKKINKQRLQLLNKIKNKVPIKKGQFQHFIFLYQRVFYKNIYYDFLSQIYKKDYTILKTVLISIKKILLLEKQIFFNNNSYKLNVDLKFLIKKIQKKKNQPIFSKIQQILKVKWIGPRLWIQLIKLNLQHYQSEYFFNICQQALLKQQYLKYMKNNSQQLIKFVKMIKKIYYKKLNFIQHNDHKLFDQINDYNQSNNNISLGTTDSYSYMNHIQLQQINEQQNNLDFLNFNQYI